jgi:hypothetical protein
MGMRITVVFNDEYRDVEWQAVDNLHTLLRGVTHNFRIVKVERTKKEDD